MSDDDATHRLLATLSLSSLGMNLSEQVPYREQVEAIMGRNWLDHFERAVG